MQNLSERKANRTVFPPGCDTRAACVCALLWKPVIRLWGNQLPVSIPNTEQTILVIRGEKGRPGRFRLAAETRKPVSNVCRTKERRHPSAGGGWKHLQSFSVFQPFDLNGFRTGSRGTLLENETLRDPPDGPTSTSGITVLNPFLTLTEMERLFGRSGSALQEKKGFQIFWWKKLKE